MLSIAIWEAWECCDFHSAAHSSLLVSGESGGIAGASPEAGHQAPGTGSGMKNPRWKNSVVHFTCDYYSNYFSFAFFLPLFQTRSDPCCCLCATGYGRAERTSANRRAVVGDVCSHVMCCEVFWRNDTLYNGEVHRFPSPHRSDAHKMRIKYANDAGVGGADVSAQRWGSSRRWTDHTAQHASFFFFFSQASVAIHDSWRDGEFEENFASCPFFEQQVMKRRSAINWWCWAPCSSMDESSRMICRCVTTQTDRSEKLNCYFAVVFSMLQL